MQIAMALRLAKVFYREIIISILTIMFIVTLMTVSSKNNQIETLKASHKAEVLSLQLDSEVAKNEFYDKAIRRYDEAMEVRAKKIDEVIADYDNTITANDSLHKTINNIERTLITANADARADYTKTINTLFKDCTSRYIEMAGNAQKHSDDYDTLRGYIERGR